MKKSETIRAYVLSALKHRDGYVSFGLLHHDVNTRLQIEHGYGATRAQLRYALLVLNHERMVSFKLHERGWFKRYSYKAIKS